MEEGTEIQVSIRNMEGVPGEISFMERTEF